ncbi:hypothetical protein MKEN_00063000 [Mycena kentingensis (nom. inval.)]|nr:hypothetical protein MKEN_00063000 [Mycena kentingensis (nom. inval.)]
MISFVLFWYLLSVVAQQTPLSTQPKLVVAHFMVGFTFPYTIADWSLDIRLAAAKGIDGFALNVGRDDWQPQRVRDAYAAAKQLSPGITFKLFISLDMTSLPCSTAQDANRIRSYISDYRTHPNQLYYNGAPLLSTFSGEWCTFGQNGQNRLNAAWYYAIRDKQPSVSFIPAFFVDPKAFPSLNFIDGAFNWNSAWPMGNYNTSLAPDNEYTTQLRGRAYMAGISPWFFTLE